MKITNITALPCRIPSGLSLSQNQVNLSKEYGLGVSIDIKKMENYKFKQ